MSNSKFDWEIRGDGDEKKYSLIYEEKQFLTNISSAIEVDSLVDWLNEIIEEEFRNGISQQGPYVIEASSFDGTYQERQYMSLHEDVWTDEAFPGEVHPDKPVVVRRKTNVGSKPTAEEVAANAVSLSNKGEKYSDNIVKALREAGYLND